jgi:predicted ArsR family transcriptional regulator
VPTREAILEELSRSAAPLGVAELAVACDVHQNTVRLHLDALLEAGLVVRTTEIPSHRGRPGYRYRAVLADPYRELASWLAEAVRTGSTARDTGRRNGRREVDPAGVEDSSVTLFDLLAHYGFAPTWGAEDPPRSILLHQCPFDAVAADDPATICNLHLGLAEGVAEATGDEIGGLEPSWSRPDRPCVLRVGRR